MRILFVLTLLSLVIYSGLEASDNKGMLTKALIDNWSNEIYSYKDRNGKFPNNDDGLKALCNKQNSDCSEEPKDAWYNSLEYIYPSKYGNKEFDLYSFGENEKDEFGKGDDISNWTSLSTIHYYPAKWIVAIFFIAAALTVLLIIFIRLRRKKFRSIGA
jgi:hypothetical protein